MTRDKWKWYGNAGHLCVGYDCRFHLCTKVGPWLVSTVGQYWPSRSSREIHASIYDPKWLSENKALRGDYFEAAYMKRFGFEEIGAGRTFETMVFRAGEVCKAKGCACGMPTTVGGELDFAGYNDAGAATTGHMAMCAKWSKRPASFKGEAAR